MKFSPTTSCICHRCLRENEVKSSCGLPMSLVRMVSCSTCGNKRCPHATDHDNECTGSNERGQSGSEYQ